MTAAGAALVETHSAAVFFVGDRAYKLKKPVALGFLDFSTREAREVVCHREVALNRRLAPDVYLGVADVIGPDGVPCDHLVVMRRMPDDHRLSTLVAAGADVTGALDGLAVLLAEFHRRADTSAEIERAAGRDALAARWRANVAQCERFFAAATLARIGELADAFLAGRGPLFDARVAAGRARDGHGDLLADDVFCLDDGPRVLDCLEFDDRLRWDDTLADAAFLAMDLERLGRPDLALRFLDRYRGASGDSWPASLAHHHIAYRALVRAKVAAIRHEQGDEGAADAAQRLVDLSLQHAEDGAVRLVLVGGLPGTGKSTLAAALGERLGAVVVRSDVVRKAEADMPDDLYGPEATDRTYGALMEQARTALAMGESVVLDATWHDARRRDRARAVAVETSSALVELRCTVPAEVAERRLLDRAAAGTDASDATPAVAKAMAAEADPWLEAADVDTDHAIDEVVAVAERVVRAR